MSSKEDVSQGNRADFGLEAFQDRPDDAGLSLDDLSQAFAQMLERGQDPYEPGERGPLESAVTDTPAAQPPEEQSQEEDAQQIEVSPRSILEAMLFVGSASNEPLTSERVASLMRGVRPAEIDELVRDLNRQYAAERRAYRIASEGAGYRMALRDEMAGVRDKFYGRVRQARLSPAAIEVLALIAYNGSLSGEQVTRLRGTPSGAILSLLVRRQLLRIERPDEAPRMPHYHTTGRFLEVFGLESLEDLPRSEELDQR